MLAIRDENLQKQRNSIKIKLSELNQQIEESIENAKINKTIEFGSVKEGPKSADLMTKEKTFESLKAILESKQDVTEAPFPTNYN